MINQYKEFFLSDQILDVAPYAQSIIDDDLETFVQAYEAYADEDIMIDPIEIAAAYQSNTIFNYLLHTYDYSEYHNPFGLILPVILIVFERESMLVDALDYVTFKDVYYILMYEYMIHNKDFEYFKQYYTAYKIAKTLKTNLLIVALNRNEVFDYLATSKSFKSHVTDKALVLEIINHHPSMLSYIRHITNLSDDFSLEAFVPVLKLEDETLFKTTIDFILERNMAINDVNEFGLTFFHEALRHAKHSSYIFYLFEKGANPFFKTSRGYASSHQLLFRDAAFTLELSRIIDFDAKDYFGMTLKDYDLMQRKTTLSLLDVLLIVKLVLNMDESAIYELDNNEFYDLAETHGIHTFLNAYSVIIFENAHLKELFEHTIGKDLDAEDVEPLKEALQEAFLYDEDHTLELTNDLIGLIDEDYDDLTQFAKEHKTTIKITTDGVDINKIGHIDIIIKKDGSIKKEATIHTNYLDVYYIHKFYDVPLDNITYIPPTSKDQRFLN